ncbi:hypothetical protein L596_002401 [Steinernema carpocapsae]|uniref:Uncharacterized protein n=1 Tax=Steinernema carpocapsae TaxID=34508 RepID=A0A4U8UPE8_STECR|nr:hypothetical protein L596_002401 [Steinernema carpocapsae]
MKLFSSIESLLSKKYSKTPKTPSKVDHLPEKSSFKRSLSLGLSRRRSRSCDPSKRSQRTSDLISMYSVRTQNANLAADRAKAKRIASEILEILEKQRETGPATSGSTVSTDI